MKKIVLVLILLLSGCATPQYLQSNFQAAEYNSLSNTYSNMLTKVEEYIEDDVICVSNEKFGQGWTRTCLDKNKIDEHVAGINKYIKWFNLAEERGDLITKDIVTVSQDSTMYVYDLDYSIYMGKILAITNNEANAIYPVVTYFNYKEAVKFSKYLINYKNGTHKQIDTSVYN